MTLQEVFQFRNITSSHPFMVHVGVQVSNIVSHVSMEHTCWNHSKDILTYNMANGYRLLICHSLLLWYLGSYDVCSCAWELTSRKVWACTCEWKMNTLVRKFWAKLKCRTLSELWLWTRGRTCYSQQPKSVPKIQSISSRLSHCWFKKIKTRQILVLTKTKDLNKFLHNLAKLSMRNCEKPTMLLLNLCVRRPKSY